MLKAHFDDAQLLEAIALIGYYHTISFLCVGLALPLESYAARFPVDQTGEEKGPSAQGSSSQLAKGPHPEEAA